MAYTDDLKSPLVQEDSADVGRRRKHDHQNGPAITDDAANGVLVFDYSEMKRTAQVLSATISYTNLTDAALFQVLGIGTIPANSIILATAGALATAFAIPSAGSITLDIGTAVDDDSIVDGGDLMSASVDGQMSTLPAGIAPNRFFASATALTATVRSDENVSGATAGSVTIRVAYAVVG